MQTFKDIYNYRELLKSCVKKDIRGKYKGSVLGILWSFINPLLQVVVYWIVFPYLMRASSFDNYLCYLVTGIIPWTFFTTVVNNGTGTMIANAGIIKKVYFPRQILLISQVISGIINFFISCIIILIFCIGTGAGVSWHLIYLLPVVLVQSVLSLGIIYILSSVNVYLRDVEYIVQFILNMAFYGTPILYSMEMVPAGSILHTLISINPLSVLVNCYRDIFLNHVIPNMGQLAGVAGLSLVVLVIGHFIFNKLQRGFAEEL